MKDIFKSLDKDFILNSFKKNKLFKDIIDLKIKKNSPDWAKDSCLVRYEILLKNRSKKIIRGTAKKEFSREEIWKTMKDIYLLGFNKGSLQSPKPILYIKEINLLLYQEAEGTPLVEIIKKNNKESERAMIYSAKWLFKLHSLPTKNFKKATFIGKKGYINIFKKITNKEKSILKNIPSSSNLNLIEKGWKKEEKRLIHNDFYPGNAIFGKKVFYGIDFDKTGVGPFLMDIATIYGSFNFPKSAWESKINQKSLKNLWNIFLETYITCLNKDSVKEKKKKIEFSDFENSIKIFKAKVFLDQACYFSSFLEKGWDFMNQKFRKEFISKIQFFLKKANREFNN